MKTLLIGFIFAVAVLAWRSEDLASLLGSRAVSDPPAELTAMSLLQSPGKEQRAMTMQEFAELSRTDPAAYQKLLASHQQPTERSEVDKLMNFLARGKYE